MHSTPIDKLNHVRHAHPDHYYGRTNLPEIGIVPDGPGCVRWGVYRQTRVKYGCRLVAAHTSRDTAIADARARKLTNVCHRLVVMGFPVEPPDMLPASSTRHIENPARVG